MTRSVADGDVILKNEAEEESNGRRYHQLRILDMNHPNQWELSECLAKRCIPETLSCDAGKATLARARGIM